MLKVLTVLLMAQGTESRSPVGVLVTSKRPGAEGHATKVAAKVREALKREGLDGALDDAAMAKALASAGAGDPKACEGGQTCVSKLARMLSPRAVVVGVDVGKLGRSLAIHLEAVAADLEEPLAAVDIIKPVDKWPDASSQAIAAFAKQVVDKVKVVPATPPIAVVTPPPLVTPPPDDRPRATTLEPKPATAPTLSLRAEDLQPPKPSRTGALVLTGAAVAAAGAAGTFAFLGFSDKAKYDAALVKGPNGVAWGSTLTREEANALATSANTKLTIALASAIGSAVLAGAATWFWVKR